VLHHEAAFAITLKPSGSQVAGYVPVAGVSLRVEAQKVYQAVRVACGGSGNVNQRLKQEGQQFSQLVKHPHLLSAEVVRIVRFILLPGHIDWHEAEEFSLRLIHAPKKFMQ